MKKLFLIAVFAFFPSVALAQGTPGIDCFQQRASALNHCNTFDLPNNTGIAGQATGDGKSVWADSSTNAVVIDGVLTNAPNTSVGGVLGNSYPGFANTPSVGGAPQSITQQWGTFKYFVDSPLCALTLIPAQTSAMSKFLHLEVCQDHWTFGVADSPTYPFNTVLGAAPYPALTPGVEYRSIVGIDSVNCKAYLTLADESTKTITHPSICDVDPKYAIFQIGGYAGVGKAGWTAVGTGPIKSSTFVAAGGGAALGAVNEIRRASQKVSGQVAGVLGTPKLIATYTNTGAQMVNRIRVNTVMTDYSAYLPSYAVEVDDREIVTYSNGASTFVGSIKSLNNTTLTPASICLMSTLTASMSGSPGYPHTLSIYVQPNTTGGCANNWAVTQPPAAGARINYTVEVDGDPNGTLTAQ